MRMPWRSKSAPLVASLSLLAIVIGPSVACRGATEITLTVRTNADCAKWKGVAVFVGAPGADVESRAPTLTTVTCEGGGQVGTLTIVPTAAKGDEVGIRVVAGLARNPEDCRSNAYEGCIVARRAIRFEPHQSVNVVVDLTTECTGLACDPFHTCVNGSCLESRTSVVNDPDAAPTGPTVRCGDNGVRCPTTGAVCCLTANISAKTATGECKEVSSCPHTSSVLYCDDDNDCAGMPGDNGGPAVCCIAGAVGYCNLGGTTLSGSQCVAPSKCSGSMVLCEDRKPCAGQNVCQPPGDGLPLPNYYTCCFAP